MIGAHHFQRGSRGWLLILLRWAAAILVIGVLLHFLPLAPLRAAIWKVPVWRFEAVLLVYLLAHSMGVAKWGNVVDRFLDVAAQAGLVVLGLALLPELELFPEQLEDKAEYALLGTACAAILLLVLVYRFRKKLLGGRSMRFRRRLARLRHALRAVSRRPQVLVFGWLLGTLIQTVFLVLTAQLAIYCGLRLPLRMWLFAWPLAKLVAVLPLTQGGIGVREAALVALLTPFGAAAHLVFAAGLVWEGIVIAGGLIAGLVAFALRRMQT